MKQTTAANPGFLMTLNGRKAKMATKKKPNPKVAKAANHKPKKRRNPGDLKGLPIMAACILGGAAATRFVARFIPIQRTQLIDVGVQAGVAVALGYGLAKTHILTETNAYYVAGGGMAAALSTGVSYYFPTLQEQILHGAAIVVPTPQAPTASAPAGGVADVVVRARDGKVIGMGSIQPYPDGIQHQGVYGGMNGLERYPRAA